MVNKFTKQIIIVLILFIGLMLGFHSVLALTCGAGCVLVTDGTAYCRCSATTTTPPTTTPPTTTPPTTTRPPTTTTPPTTTPPTTTRPPTTTTPPTTAPNGICPSGKCAGFSDSDCDDTTCSTGQVCSNGTCVNGNCINGTTQSCVTSNGACTGIRTCSASSWGECVSTQPNCPPVSGCTGCATAGCGECSSTSAGFLCYCSGSLGNGVYTSCQGASGHSECTGGGDCGITGGNNCGGLNQPRCGCGCGPGLTSCTNAFGVFCAYDCTPTTTTPPACQNGQTQSCAINGCAGTKICSNNIWGECVDNAGDGCPAATTCTYTVCECSGGNCSTVTKSGTVPCPTNEGCRSCPTYNTCSDSRTCTVSHPGGNIMTGGSCPTGCTSNIDCGIENTKDCHWLTCSSNSCSISNNSTIPISQNCPTGCNTNNDCSTTQTGTAVITSSCGGNTATVNAVVNGGVSPYTRYTWYKQSGSTGWIVDYSQSCSSASCSNSHAYTLSGQAINVYLAVGDSAGNTWASNILNINCSTTANKCGIDANGAMFCSASGTGTSCNSVSDCGVCKKR